MFKIFWYKYTLRHLGNEYYFYTRLADLTEYCLDNFGPLGKRWKKDLAVSKFGHGVTSVTYKFKSREDYVMFKLANM